MSIPVRMPAAFTSAPAQQPNADVPRLDRLTPIEERFIYEYLIDLDPRQAAIRAGAPVAAAGARANRWMKHELVREAIGRAMAERARRVGINADRILQRLGALALGDPTAVFNEHGGLKKPGEMDEHDRLLVAGVKTRRTMALNPITGEMDPEEVVEVKVIDQVAALNMAMKHLGLLNDKVTVEHTSLADRLREAQLRREGKLPAGPVIEAEFVEVDDGDGLSSGSSDDAELEAGPQDHAADRAPPTLAAPPVGDLDYDPITGEPVLTWNPLD